MGSKRRRLGAEGWQALLGRFETTGLTVQAFCRREAISAASFYRWRGLASGRRPCRARSTAAAMTSSPESVGFVDLGTLGEHTSPGHLELRLDLGGGLTVQLSRG